MYEENHEISEKTLKINKRVSLDYQHTKMIEFFILNKTFSYNIVEAGSNYYDFTLEERKNILGAHSVDVLCKTIILENTAYDDKYETDYYKKFYMVIVQYTSEFNADKIAKIMKTRQNDNSNDKLSNKFFHFRLAKNDIAYDMTGYKFNSITPYLMKDDRYF